MNTQQVLLPRFEQALLASSGLNASEALRGEDGWLFVPLGAAKTLDPEWEIATVLGLRPHEGDDSGWWVKPWANIVAGTFVALTLSDDGLHSFSFLRDGVAGRRYPYYISEVGTGGITTVPMLLGQFLFEFEKYPDCLKLRRGSTNRIYYPRDKRVESYSELTPEELADAVDRLEILADNYPKAAEILAKFRTQ